MGALTPQTAIFEHGEATAEKLGGRVAVAKGREPLQLFG